MNQIKRSLALILCLSCGLFTAFAQTDLDDNTIYLEGDTNKTYTLSVGRQWTRDEMTFYRFSLTASQDLVLFNIMHEGPKTILAEEELRIFKEYAGKQTTARILFANGYSANYDVLIKDTTNPKTAEYTAGITYVIVPISGDTEEIIDKNISAFMEHDISKITVGGLTSVISSDIKTARFFLSLGNQYSSIVEKKQKLENTSSFPPYSVQQNLTLANMLTKPMGCASTDLLNDPVKTIKANLEKAFHVDVDDDAHSISVVAYYNDICKNMTYRGLKFSRFRIYDGDGNHRSVLYGFDLNKRDGGQLLPVLNQIASDFRSLGIPMTVQPSSDTSYGTHAKKDGIEYTLYAQDYNVMWDITVEIRM
jgi:hypothetical protein